MITYTKTGWTIGLLLRLYGSAIPRSIPVAAISAGGTMYLHFFWGDYLRMVWRNPFPFQIFGTIVGFIVVFRAQWAHERYIAGRNSLQTMTARWADAVAQALSFDQHTPPEGAGEEWRGEAACFQRAVVHLASLMHGVALQHLRGDWDLDNLVEHDHHAPPPANDAKFIPKADYPRNPFYDLMFLRAGKPQKQLYYRAAPIGVIGDVTGSEVETMTRRSDPRKGSPPRPSITFDSTMSSGIYIAGAGERVNVVSGWLYSLLTARRHAGGLNIDAPVLANVWTRLADGYNSFEQCRMLVDTPFPFPWAQLLTLLMVLYVITLPLVMAAYLADVVISTGLTFVAAITYWATNEVARDLEDPFVFDPNDLPTARLQVSLREMLQFGSPCTRALSFRCDLLSTDWNSWDCHHERSRFLRQ